MGDKKERKKSSIGGKKNKALGKIKCDKEIIRLTGVSKIYHMGDTTVRAVDGIDVCISEGDFVAIMGPSGSGKSTSMNLVGSLDMPSMGKILLDGEDISTLTESDLAQIRGKKIGFIFQNFNLIPNLTVKENVMLPMMFQGTDIYERAVTAEDLLRKVDLGDRMDHYPNQISGGQMQRVAIARALANDPEVILADEPTGNLDTKTGEKVMEFLQQLNKEGKTIIMVTHEPELAEAYAEKVYWLRDGKVEKTTHKKNGFKVEAEERALHRKHGWNGKKGNRKSRKGLDKKKLVKGKQAKKGGK
ncbi:ABC transporter ATP-binding protein [archaeon]|jgi:putative ABC transport system ATP-binding protein|nr:ABC transporter ATP-binding protein [archaeon]MBT3577859.1 ABC transporter ATP-binding protein [archaeon]MBT6819777.1 ABC transporter ATP-binding protein [archaeon]MBT6955802.1 ABC transporter ATP-binding protein [archaeon]MBT7025559.1 ABC transporter ATP-binding protein [archaeon]